MKILHTSDWHLGRTLYGKKRYAEFEGFLDWLLETIKIKAVDVLIVAGDVFDTTTPSNRAQQLYYRFLCRVAASPCRHVVVVGGNHDSPSFLDAPKELLNFLDVHVIGSPTEKIEDELLMLNDPNGDLELLVCAVPYLRDRDIRSFEAGESFEDKDRKLAEGIAKHYREIGGLAEEKRVSAGWNVPVVATGHLFTAGGRTLEGDGVRDLYIGSLAQVGTDCFPACLDYIALGHLHLSQQVGHSEVIRYSGAPLPMSPGEAGQNKSVLLVDFVSNIPKVEEVDVPVFQELECIVGDMKAIELRLRELLARSSAAWLEIVYEGEALVPNLRVLIDSQIAGSRMEVLRVRDARTLRSASKTFDLHEMLDELSLFEVFQRCMDARAVPEEQRPELLGAYKEVITWLQSEDLRAE